jgi:hypothetical protein
VADAAAEDQAQGQEQRQGRSQHLRLSIDHRRRSFGKSLLIRIMPSEGYRPGRRDGEGTMPTLRLDRMDPDDAGPLPIHRSCRSSVPPEERPALELLREVAQVIHH